MLEDVYKTILRWGYKTLYGLQGKLSAVEELERSQWFSSAEIEALQIRKLRRLLKHARSHVPYYQDRLRGIDLGPGFNAEMFRQIPILTKQDVQENLTQLQAEGIEGKKNHTGGSTGTPLTFYQDDQYWRYNFADKIRTYRMCGYEIGDKVAFFWGSDADSRAHKSRISRLWDRLAMNLIWVNVFDINEEQLEEEAYRLARFQPKLIVGYATSLFQLARLIEEKKISGIHPHAIQSSAEVLTSEMRERIEDTFNCKVYDRYGCREMGNVAHECSEHQGLHILAENNYVEFLDPKGVPILPGEEGLVTVTNLNNFAMPLIRYQVGDIGVPSLEYCACRRGLPLMKVIKGRVGDVIRAPNGKILHGEFFSHLMYNVKNIRNFQVLQESRTQLTIKLVTLESFNKSTLHELRDKINAYGDRDFDIRFEIHESLPASSSGKYRFVTSEVES